jgi:hypothetical protein
LNLVHEEERYQQRNPEKSRVEIWVRNFYSLQSNCVRQCRKGGKRLAEFPGMEENSIVLEMEFFAWPVLRKIQKE